MERRGYSSHHVAKEALRVLVRGRIAAMSSAERAQEGAWAAAALLALPELRAANRVALYQASVLVSLCSLLLVC